jgi:hypothetical protein
MLAKPLNRPLLACSLALVASLSTACIDIGEPIPSDRARPGQAPFIGQVAKRKPLSGGTPVEHPFLAPAGRNGMHGDAYASDTHPYPGPLGKGTRVRSASFNSTIGGLCATTVFDAAGRVYTVCTDLVAARLAVLAPRTLEVLDTYDLPLRASNQTLDITNVMSDTSGGAYFHLLKGDRPLIATADNHLRIFSFDGSTLGVDEDWDLSPYLPAGSTIVDALPDFDGLYWIITRQGHIGTFDAETGSFKLTSLAGEQVQNSVAVAADGVYLVSDFALYRFEAAEDGTPSFSWRIPYDRGSARKPGAINQGSGTTPTLLEGGLVAISDNADARVNVLVYHRLPDHTGERQVCATPVFEPGLGFTENSLIGFKNSLIIENNYGYTGPLSNTWARPGLTRVDVRPDLSGCDVVWTNGEEGMTPVAKLSTDNGLIYTYTRQRVANPLAQLWYFTAVDFVTGKTVYKVNTGNGTNYNNNYGPIALDPRGNAYVGVLNGLVSVYDP